MPKRYFEVSLERSGRKNIILIAQNSFQDAGTGQEVELKRDLWETRIRWMSVFLEEEKNKKKSRRRKILSNTVII